MASARRKAADGGVAAADAAASEEPQEFSRPVYAVWMLLGLGLLTPWNIVLNACVTVGGRCGMGTPGAAAQMV
jgi:hypothetical protein